MMTHDTTKPELLPCPFCGGNNLLWELMSYIICDDCGTEGPGFGPNLETPEIAWNTRADPEKVECGECKHAGTYVTGDGITLHPCNEFSGHGQTFARLGLCDNGRGGERKPTPQGEQ